MSDLSKVKKVIGAALEQAEANVTREINLDVFERRTAEAVMKEYRDQFQKLGLLGKNHQDAKAPREQVAKDIALATLKSHQP